MNNSPAKIQETLILLHDGERVPAAIEGAPICDGDVHIMLYLISKRLRQVSDISSLMLIEDIKKELESFDTKTMKWAD